jgi:hypothetical protein
MVPADRNATLLDIFYKSDLLSLYLQDNFTYSLQKAHEVNGQTGGYIHYVRNY